MTSTLQCPVTPVSGIVPVGHATLNCWRPGVYCARCRWRMLPSCRKGDHQYFYCMVCFGSVTRTGEVGTIISILIKERFGPQAVRGRETQERTSTFNAQEAKCARSVKTSG